MGMANSPTRWVMDTSTFTHFWRAGHGYVLRELAPSSIVIIPSEVSSEVESGRDQYADIPPLKDLHWVELAVLDQDSEYFTFLGVKADMGGASNQHLGECAVIACAQHRELTAILDERAATKEAERRNVETQDTMWIAVDAYKNLFDRDRSRAAALIDDLLATGMRLPVDSGESLFQWGYENGLLP